MITIYHNPRCTKSREGLCAIEKLSHSFTIRKYLDDPFTKKELKEVIKKLDIKPLELVRIKESIWIKNYKNKQFSDEEIIDILLLHPNLIERPIVIFENKAVIARPKEMIYELIK